MESVGTTVNLQIKFGQVGSKCVSLIGLLHMKQMAMILMRRQQRECVCTHTCVCVCVRVCQREKERDKVKGGVRKVKRDQNDSLA